MLAVSEYELQLEFNEFLDEVSPVLRVAGVTISPSVALRECDPIAYREAFLDWCDYEGRELA
jgi:hypothetical protein